ncbi:MAG: M48 family metalloprotease, partial [Rhodospirillaceae bacterium]|nr:M48 family metalloprotease [Rhodospirillaceae bacterium]
MKLCSRYIHNIIFIPLLLLALLVLSACSANPATGEQSFTAFMSPEREKEVGREEHPKIIKAFGGVFDDAEIGAYVANIGGKLSQHSEMPDLVWTFTVLNNVKINAFALPGGYVYITRGLLSLASNEAEIAGVLS